MHEIGEHVFIFFTEEEYEAAGDSVSQSAHCVVYVGLLESLSDHSLSIGSQWTTCE